MPMPFLLLFLLFALVLILLGGGAWGILASAVALSTAGGIDDDAERMKRIRVAVAILLVGAFLFFAGAMGAARLVGA